MDLQEGQEQPKEHIDLPQSENKGLVWLKNLFIIIALLLVISASFWISFNLGKKILTPVKKEPIRTLSVEEYIQVAPTEEMIAVYEDLKAETKKVEPKAVKKALKPRGTLYRVIAGTYGTKGSAQSVVATLKSSGIDSFVVKRSGKYAVQAGAYRSKKNAQNQQNKLLKLGFSARIVDP